MSVYTPQNMILASGIIAWILLIVVLVFKKEKYMLPPGLAFNMPPQEVSKVLTDDCFSDCQAIQRGPGTKTWEACKNECKQNYAVGGIGYNNFNGF